MSWPLVVGLGVVVTLLAIPESYQLWPYAPFPLLHAGLCILVPLWFGAWPRRQPLALIGRSLRQQGAPAAAAIVFISCFVLGYRLILQLVGRSGDPDWNLLVTYRELMARYVHRHGVAVVVVVSYLLLGLWPMFGEELFYRCFLLRGLLRRFSGWTSSILTSTLFGLRHAAQLVYLVPAYPLVSGAAYFVWAFGLSMIWCWLYVRTRGEAWLCIASHAVNIVLAPFALIFLLS